MATEAELEEKTSEMVKQNQTNGVAEAIGRSSTLNEKIKDDAPNSVIQGISSASEGEVFIETPSEDKLTSEQKFVDEGTTTKEKVLQCREHLKIDEKDEFEEAKDEALKSHLRPNANLINDMPAEQTTNESSKMDGKVTIDVSETQEEKDLGKISEEYENSESSPILEVKEQYPQNGEITQKNAEEQQRTERLGLIEHGKDKEEKITELPHGTPPEEQTDDSKIGTSLDTQLTNQTQISEALPNKGHHYKNSADQGELETKTMTSNEEETHHNEDSEQQSEVKNNTDGMNHEQASVDEHSKAIEEIESTNIKSDDSEKENVKADTLVKGEEYSDAVMNEAAVGLKKVQDKLEESTVEETSLSEINEVDEAGEIKNLDKETKDREGPAVSSEEASHDATLDVTNEQVHGDQNTASNELSEEVGFASENDETMCKKDDCATETAQDFLEENIQRANKGEEESYGKKIGSEDDEREVKGDPDVVSQGDNNVTTPDNTNTKEIMPEVEQEDEAMTKVSSNNEETEGEKISSVKGDSEPTKVKDYYISSTVGDVSDTCKPTGKPVDVDGVVDDVQKETIGSTCKEQQQENIERNEINEDGEHGEEEHQTLQQKELVSEIENQKTTSTTEANKMEISEEGESLMDMISESVSLEETKIGNEMDNEKIKESIEDNPSDHALPLQTIHDAANKDHEEAHQNLAGKDSNIVSLEKESIESKGPDEVQPSESEARQSLMGKDSNIVNLEKESIKSKGPDEVEPSESEAYQKLVGKDSSIISLENESIESKGPEEVQPSESDAHQSLVGKDSNIVSLEKESIESKGLDDVQPSESEAAKVGNFEGEDKPEVTEIVCANDDAETTSVKEAERVDVDKDKTEYQEHENVRESMNEEKNQEGANETQMAESHKIPEMNDLSAGKAFETNEPAMKDIHDKIETKHEEEVDFASNKPIDQITMPEESQITEEENTISENKTDSSFPKNVIENALKPNPEKNDEDILKIEQSSHIPPESSLDIEHNIVVENILKPNPQEKDEEMPKNEESSHIPPESSPDIDHNIVVENALKLDPEEKDEEMVKNEEFSYITLECSPDIDNNIVVKNAPKPDPEEKDEEMLRNEKSSHIPPESSPDIDHNIVVENALKLDPEEKDEEMAKNEVFSHITPESSPDIDHNIVVENALKPDTEEKDEEMLKNEESSHIPPKSSLDIDHNIVERLSHQDEGNKIFKDAAQKTTSNNQSCEANEEQTEIEKLEKPNELKQDMPREYFASVNSQEETLHKENLDGVAETEKCEEEEENSLTLEQESLVDSEEPKHWPFSIYEKISDVTNQGADSEPGSACKEQLHDNIESNESKEDDEQREEKYQNPHDIESDLDVKKQETTSEAQSTKMKSSKEDENLTNMVSGSVNVDKDTKIANIKENVEDYRGNNALPLQTRQDAMGEKHQETEDSSIPHFDIESTETEGLDLIKEPVAKVQTGEAEDINVDYIEDKDKPEVSESAYVNNDSETASMKEMADTEINNSNINNALIEKSKEIPNSFSEEKAHYVTSTKDGNEVDGNEDRTDHHKHNTISESIIEETNQENENKTELTKSSEVLENATINDDSETAPMKERADTETNKSNINDALSEKSEEIPNSFCGKKVHQVTSTKDGNKADGNEDTTGYQEHNNVPESITEEQNQENENKTELTKNNKVPESASINNDSETASMKERAGTKINSNNINDALVEKSEEIPKSFYEEKVHQVASTKDGNEVDSNEDRTDYHEHNIISESITKETNQENENKTKLTKNNEVHEMGDLTKDPKTIKTKDENLIKENISGTLETQELVAEEIHDKVDTKHEEEPNFVCDSQIDQTNTPEDNVDFGRNTEKLDEYLEARKESVVTAAEEKDQVAVPEEKSQDTISKTETNKIENLEEENSNGDETFGSSFENNMIENNLELALKEEREEEIPKNEEISYILLETAEVIPEKQIFGEDGKYGDPGNIFEKISHQDGRSICEDAAPKTVLGNQIKEANENLKDATREEDVASATENIKGRELETTDNIEEREVETVEIQTSESNEIKDAAYEVPKCEEICTHNESTNIAHQDEDSKNVNNKEEGSTFQKIENTHITISSADEAALEYPREDQKVLAAMVGTEMESKDISESTTSKEQSLEATTQVDPAEDEMLEDQNYKLTNEAFEIVNPKEEETTSKIQIVPALPENTEEGIETNHEANPNHDEETHEHVIKDNVIDLETNGNKSKKAAEASAEILEEHSKAITTEIGVVAEKGLMEGEVTTSEETSKLASKDLDPQNIKVASLQIREKALDEPIVEVTTSEETNKLAFEDLDPQNDKVESPLIKVKALDEPIVKVTTSEETNKLVSEDLDSQNDKEVESPLTREKALDEPIATPTDLVTATEPASTAEEDNVALEESLKSINQEVKDSNLVSDEHVQENVETNPNGIQPLQDETTADDPLSTKELKHELEMNALAIASGDEIRDIQQASETTNETLSEKENKEYQEIEENSKAKEMDGRYQEEINKKLLIGKECEPINTDECNKEIEDSEATVGVTQDNKNKEKEVHKSVEIKEMEYEKQEQQKAIEVFEANQATYKDESSKEESNAIGDRFETSSLEYEDKSFDHHNEPMHVDDAIAGVVAQEEIVEADNEIFEDDKSEAKNKEPEEEVKPKETDATLNEYPTNKVNEADAILAEKNVIKDEKTEEEITPREMNNDFASKEMVVLETVSDQYNATSWEAVSEALKANIMTFDDNEKEKDVTDKIVHNLGVDKEDTSSIVLTEKEILKKLTTNEAFDDIQYEKESFPLVDNKQNEEKQQTEQDVLPVSRYLMDRILKEESGNSDETLEVEFKGVTQEKTIAQVAYDTTISKREVQDIESTKENINLVEEQVHDPEKPVDKSLENNDGIQENNPNNAPKVLEVDEDVKGEVSGEITSKEKDREKEVDDEELKRKDLLLDKIPITGLQEIETTMPKDSDVPNEREKCGTEMLSDIPKNDKVANETSEQLKSSLSEQVDEEKLLLQSVEILRNSHCHEADYSIKSPNDEENTLEEASETLPKSVEVENEEVKQGQISENNMLEVLKVVPEGLKVKNGEENQYMITESQTMMTNVDLPEEPEVFDSQNIQKPDTKLESAKETVKLDEKCLEKINSALCTKEKQSEKVENEISKEEKNDGDKKDEKKEGNEHKSDDFGHNTSVIAEDSQRVEVDNEEGKQDKIPEANKREDLATLPQDKNIENGDENRDTTTESKTMMTKVNLLRELEVSDSQKVQKPDTEMESVKEIIEPDEKSSELINLTICTEEKQSENVIIANSEEEKTDDDDEKDQRQREDEHKAEDTGNNAAVIVEARDAELKPTHKKSHNILSGVGSKVKHSLAKVKKAITGKSSHPKTVSPR